MKFNILDQILSLDLELQKNELEKCDLQITRLLTKDREESKEICMQIINLDTRIKYLLSKIKSLEIKILKND